MIINNFQSTLDRLSHGLNPNRKVTILCIEDEPDYGHSTQKVLKGVVIAMTSSKEHGIFRIIEKDNYLLKFRDELFVYNEDYETWEFVEYGKEYRVQHWN